MNLAQDLRAPYLVSMGFKLTTSIDGGGVYQRLEKERLVVLLQGAEGVKVTCLPLGRTVERPDWSVRFSGGTPIAAVLMVLLLSPMHQVTKFDGIV
jgi:hypothetical protein